MPIEWPDRYATDRVAAHVSNEISVAAPPDIVWQHLVRAVAWPDWYPNASRVRIEGGGESLAPDTHFTWRTFGVTVSSHVRAFVPNEHIAWDGRAFLLDIYHAWVIERRPTGCWVLTEENQNGLTARLQALAMPGRMYKGHQLWLRRLKDLAER